MTTKQRVAQTPAYVRLRAEITETWEMFKKEARDQKLWMIVPDAEMPFLPYEVEQAVEPLPYVLGYRRIQATEDIPFTGWKFVFDSFLAPWK